VADVVDGVGPKTAADAAGRAKAQNLGRPWANGVQDDLGCRSNALSEGAQLECIVIRTLLAPVLGVRQDLATLDLAADLARYFHAHIDVVHVTAPRERQVLPEPVEPTLAFGGRDHTQAQGARPRNVGPRQLFDDWRSAKGLREPLQSRPRALASASFHVLPAWPTVQLPRRAQLADLICLAASAIDGPDATSELIEAVLFGAGRPVLMLPVRERYMPHALLGAPSVVGWNGSPEAVRAVAAALPFLQVSERVDVVTIDEEASRAADAYELASYLAFHGIPAPAAGIGRKDWSGGDVIDIAVDREAGLLVIGTHRHTGQRALGSATRHILAAKPLPVLMAA
jgi:nucleotide-binding universal stress UspA family protein